MKLPSRILLAAATLMAASSAQAANIVWTGATDLNWNTGTNWTGGIAAGATPTTDIADFNTLEITADTTVHLNAPKTVNGLIFGDTNITTAGGWILDNNGSAANILTLGGTTPTITVNALGAGATATISAQISGSAGLTKSGAGTLVLSGVNNYTGATTIHQGTLVVAGPISGAVNTTNQLVIADVTGQAAEFKITGGSMNINGGGTSISLGSSGTGGNGTYTQSGGTVTTNGSIFTGNLATSNLMTFSGGTFTQSAGNTHFGIVNGGSGTLAISGSATVNFNALQLGWFTGSSGAVTISGGALNVATASVIGGAVSGNVATGTFTQTGGAVTFGSNVIVGNQGNGTASISAGTFSNTAGIFYVGVGNAQTGTLNVSGTASVALNQLNLGYQTGTTSIINLDGGTLTIKSLTGGAAGAAAVANTSTINFNGGTLQAGASFTTATGVSTVVKSGGAVIDTNNFNLGMSTALTTGTGNGGLTKNGGGILTLNGANTYTGGTTISAGTLKIAAGGSIQVGAAGVNISTATAILAVDGKLVLTSTNPGLIVNSGGTVALTSGSAVLDLNGLFNGFTSGQTYNLISGGGTTGNFNSFANYTGGLTVTFDNTTGNLSFNAVPEPSEYGLIGAGALAAVAFVRRRRKLAGKVA